MGEIGPEAVEVPLQYLKIITVFLCSHDLWSASQCRVQCLEKRVQQGKWGGNF